MKYTITVARTNHRFKGLHPQVRAVLDGLPLTTSEKGVIRLTVRGMREPQIQEALNITASTLRTHKCSAYHKMGVTTQLEVVTTINRLALKLQDEVIDQMRNGKRRA